MYDSNDMTFWKRQITVKTKRSGVVRVGDGERFDCKGQHEGILEVRELFCAVTVVLGGWLYPSIKIELYTTNSVFYCL